MPAAATATVPATAQAPAPQVVVLYAERYPDLAPDFPGQAIRRYALEGFQNPGIRAATVVLGGHSLPPMYLGQPAAKIARVIASFRPELIVLETCYGASMPLLEALAATGLRSWVVAAPYQLPLPGYHYRPAFFGALAPEGRALALTTVPPYPLLRWRLDADELAAVRKSVAAMGPAALNARIRRVQPTLIKHPLPSRLAPDGVVLVPVPIRRLVATPGQR